MVRLSLLGLGLVVVPTVLAVSTVSSSGFVSSDGSVSFALNIPQADNNNDLYFTMAGRSSQSWIAIGMGSNRMANSLMFLAYADSTGKNVTISPRLSYNQDEPSYYSNMTVTALPGTGISNGNYTVNAMCTNCRSWRGGSIDPTNTQANFIFGAGPSGSLDSNDLSAGIRRHAVYGTFTMDLTKAVGAKGVPVPQTADSSGTVQYMDKTDHDFSSGLHGFMMIFAFVVLMPVGIFILRIMNSVKWHGFNQAASAALAIMGVMLGVYCATMYNRSKNFNTAHELIGAAITIALVAQFILGFMHHRIYKQTQAPTKLAPIHVWLGRITIPAGIANGFLGFPLALNPQYNWALLALCLLVVIVLVPYGYWRWRRDGMKGKTPLNAGGYGSDSDEPVYIAQQWSAAPSRSDINLGTYDQGYHSEGQNHPPIHQNPIEPRSFA